MVTDIFDKPKDKDDIIDLSDDESKDTNNVVHICLDELQTKIKIPNLLNNSLIPMLTLLYAGTK